MNLDDLLSDSARIDAGANPRTVLAGSLVAEQIAADSAADRFAAWGQSTVIDENTGTPVITPALFSELHRLAAIPATWPVGNAGVLHVYGYLFSTVETPYGLKRDRWTQGGVALALGLEPDAFVPWLEGPTTPLDRLAQAMAPILEAPDATPGTIAWLKEKIDGVTATTVVIQQPENSEAALFYAVADKLLTAFPFECSPLTLDALRSEPRRLRYNAAPSLASQKTNTAAEL